jgi:hypothetical protein
MANEENVDLQRLNVNLQRLKVDIGILNSTAYDERLKSLLAVAQQEIEKEGIILNLQTESDNELIIDYATWLWLNRREPTSFPRSLRWRMNNRLFGGNPT